VRDAPFTVSATTTRVPVPDGHTAVMSIELARRRRRRGRGGARRRSPPNRSSGAADGAGAPIVLHTAQDRPQPRSTFRWDAACRSTSDEYDAAHLRLQTCRPGA
jgi:aspartate-semialdehyde dehydrogenase